MVCEAKNSVFFHRAMNVPRYLKLPVAVLVKYVITWIHNKNSKHYMIPEMTNKND